MDPFTMMLIGSTALGGLQGMEATKRRKKDEAFRREAIRYSPWTGMADPGASQSQGNLLTGGIQGGMTGAMLGKALDMKGMENVFGKSNLAEQAEEAAGAVEGDKPFSGLADYNANLQPMQGTPVHTGTSYDYNANLQPAENAMSEVSAALAPQEQMGQPYTNLQQQAAAAPKTTALGGSRALPKKVKPKYNMPAFMQQQGPWTGMLNSPIVPNVRGY